MKTKKYAMVGINSRQDEQGNELVRRVLISYKFYFRNTFYGTKIIAKDEYFLNLKSSHQYNFFDSYYVLKTPTKLGEFQLKDKKRRYHYSPIYAQVCGIDDDILKPILFKSKSIDEAKIKFLSRKELR